MTQRNLINDKFFKESFFVLFLRIVGVILSFSVILIITNYFDVNLVGRYNYINSIILVLGSFVLLGMNDSFLQFSGKLEANNKFYLLKNLYKKKLIILFGMCTIVWVFYLLTTIFFKKALIESQIEKVLSKSMLLLFFYSICLLNFQVIRGLKKLYLSEILRNVLRYGIFLISIFIIIVNKEKDELINAYIWSFVVLSIISMVFILFEMRKLNFEDLNKENRKIKFKEIIKTSFPMTISYMSLLLMQSIDTLILKAYYGFEIIAYYGVVVKISMLTGIVLMSVNSVISPKISKLYYSRNNKDLIGIINKSIILNFVFTIPLILILLFFPKYILGFFGNNYQVASLALIIISFGQLINSLSGSVGVYLNMTGRQSIFQKILFISLTLNTILNFVLIPSYGMIGAAFSTAFSLALWNILGVIYIKKKDGILLFLNKNVFESLKQIK